MKNLFLGLAVSATTMITAQATKPVLSFNLSNTLNQERLAQSVEIPKEKLKSIVKTDFEIRDKKTGQVISNQLLSNGNLLVQLDFKPNESRTISFYKEIPKPQETKVFGRFVPERYDDFAWENNKIAFRMYGKALEKVPNQNAWGMDAWSKRTPKMVINEWYKLDNYHNDNGDGLDFFHVGSSMGAGDILPFINGKFTYLGNFTQSKIIDNGPIRFTFEVTYPEVTKEGYQISAVKRVSLDAGSQLNKLEVKYHFTGSTTLPVFAGIVHWDGKGEKSINAKDHFATYWPQSLPEGVVGTAIWFPNSTVKIVNQQKHLGAEEQVKSDQIVTFFAGAVWDKAGEITSSQEWNTYLESFAKRVNNPIKIK